MADKNKDGVSTGDLRTRERFIRENSPEPKEDGSLEGENSELEVTTIHLEEEARGLEELIELDIERGESGIDPDIVNYFRNILGPVKTLARLQEIGAENVEALIRAIKAGKYSAVVRCMDPWESEESIAIRAPSAIHVEASLWSKASKLFEHLVAETGSKGKSPKYKTGRYVELDDLHSNHNLVEIIRAEGTVYLLEAHVGSPYKKAAVVAKEDELRESESATLLGGNPKIERIV